MLENPKDLYTNLFLYSPLAAVAAGPSAPLARFIALAPALPRLRRLARLRRASCVAGASLLAKGSGKKRVSLNSPSLTPSRRSQRLRRVAKARKAKRERERGLGFKIFCYQRTC